MVTNVTMEINVHGLPYLNNGNDIVLLNTVRKVGELVLFQNFLLSLHPGISLGDGSKSL
jgi:hypothetical protein